MRMIIFNLRGFCSELLPAPVSELFHALAVLCDQVTPESESYKAG